MFTLNQPKKLLNDSIRMELADTLHAQDPIMSYELQGLLISGDHCPPELFLALENWFHDHGIVPKQLGEEFTQSPSCFSELKGQVMNSILGFVVLDGLSPFIPYALGFIKGNGLPVITIHSAKAQVNVKAVYEQAEKSGLEKAVFDEQLINPPLNPGIQLPELERNKITRISLNKSDVNKLQAVLNPSLENYSTAIGAKLAAKIYPELFKTPAINGKFTEIFQKLIRIYLFIPIDSLHELQEIYHEFKEFSVQNNEPLPGALVSLIATAALRTITGKQQPNQEDLSISAAAVFADDICRDFLRSTAFQQNPDARRPVLKAAGWCELILSGLSEPVVHYREAVSFFKEALQNNSPAGHDSTICQINLGIAYLKMAFQTDDSFNCRQAIEALNAALKGSFDEEYQGMFVKKYLGFTHFYLGISENKQHNFNLAVSLLKEALHYYTKSLHLKDYALINFILGNIYFELSELNNKAFHLKQALLAFEETLATYTKKHSLPELLILRTQLSIAEIYKQLVVMENGIFNYQQVINAYQSAWEFLHKRAEYHVEKAIILAELGSAYEKLAESENRRDNLKKALEFYSDALQNKNLPKALRAEELQQKVGDIFYQLANLEKKAENSNKAIEFYQLALKTFLKESKPFEYATTQNKIGLAYCNLAEVESKVENYHQAIQAFQNGLNMYAHEQHPKEYADTLNHLGNVYQQLAALEANPDNYHQAISVYQKILQTFPKNSNPERYATVQTLLGDVYRSLAQIEDNPAHYKSAITYYQESLKQKSPAQSPIEYANLHQNLGIVYCLLAKSEDKAVNCKKSIESLSQALTVQTFESFPMQFATSQHWLGKTYTLLAEVENKTSNCKVALTCFQNAIRVRTIECFPMLYGETRQNQSLAFLLLSETEDKVSNLKKSLHALGESLKFFSTKQEPESFALSQIYTGNVHLKLGEVESKPLHLKQAVTALEKALQVYTKDNYPQDYATTQNLLGNICSDLAEREKDSSYHEKAAVAYQAALQVKTFESFPKDFAMIQNSLGNIYQFLAQNEARANNLKNAYDAYLCALKVYTFERFPQLYAILQLNLQTLARELAEAEDKPEWYTSAFRAYDEALRVYTQEKYPDKYAALKKEAKELVLDLQARKLL